MKKRFLAIIVVFLLALVLLPQFAQNTSAAGQVTGNFDWKWPVPSTTSISSCFLDPEGHSSAHLALDIWDNGNYNGEIYAAYEGDVYKVHTTCTDNRAKNPDDGYACYCGSGCGGLGNSVYIRHTYKGETFISRYGHMTSVNVTVGQHVTKDTIIGTVGSTGNSGGPHLDFKIVRGSEDSWNQSAVVDPFMDCFLEVPAGQNVDARGASTSCCRTYVNEVKALYSDETPPSVSDSVKVLQVSETGFSLSCSASDEHGISSVYAVVWKYGDSESSGAKTIQGTYNSSTGYGGVRVNSSEFGNFIGNYYAVLYVKDPFGNTSSIRLESPICLIPIVADSGTYKAKEDGVVVHVAPYATIDGKSTAVPNMTTLQKGDKVSIVGNYVNSYGNTWYQLENGNWVYSENVKFCLQWSTLWEYLKSILNRNVYFIAGQAVLPNSSTKAAGTRASSNDFSYAEIPGTVYGYSANSQGTYYTVYFNANGGQNSWTEKSVAAGCAYGALPTPTKYGYDFDGWYTAANGGSHITSETVFSGSSNQTLYAHWTRGVLMQGSCGSSVSYILYSDGDLVITGSGTMTSAPWLKNYKDRILSIEIQNGVTNIYDQAFYNCTALSSVSIPDSVTSIGGSAFNGCSSLTTVTIPGSGVSIGAYVFDYCTSLETVYLPDSTLLSRRYSVFKETNTTLIITLDTGIIPDSFLGPYVASGSYYYGVQNGIRGIVVSEGITSIGGSAFRAYSDGPERIDLPDTVTSIGSYAFYKCENIQSINIPEGVTDIKEYTFYGCTSLLNVAIPSTVTSIGKNAFYTCTSLCSVDIPASVTSIGEYAFYGCSSLPTVTISGSAVTINAHAFSGCSSLNTVYVPDSAVFYTYGTTITGGRFNIPIFEGTDTTLYIMLDTGIIPDSYLWGGYSAGEMNGIKEIVVSEGITEIGTYAFRGGQTMERIILPSTVTVIGASAFAGNSASSITMPAGDPEIVTSIGSSAFSECKNLQSIRIPEGVITMNGSTFSGCSSLTDVTLPSTLVTLGSSEFCNCTSLEHIDLPRGVATVGNSCFSGCKSLKDFAFTADMTAISGSCFSDCTNLENIEIPVWITSVDYSAFQNCTGLDSVTVYDSTTLSNRVFYGDKVTLNILSQNGVIPNNYLYSYNSSASYDKMSGIAGLVIGEGITSIGTKAFYSTSSTKDLVSVTLPSTLIDLGFYAFYDCASLETINLPPKLTELKDYTFSGCSSLRSIDIHSNIMRLGSYVFANSGLESVTVPNSVTEMGAYDFANCTSLRTAQLPFARKKVENYTFSGCTALESITLPDLVNTIGDGAFMNCKSLTSIGWSSRITTISTKAFQGCESLQTVIVPETVSSIGTYAFADCISLEAITLPSETTVLQNYLFSGCDSLQTYTLPPKVTTINEGVFYDCDALQTVILPETLTSIGAKTFYDCDAFTGVELPEQLATIGGYCFYDCDALTSLTMPNSVTSIGSYLCYSSDTLESVVLSEGLTLIPECCFMDCPLLDNVVIPRYVTTINSNALNICPSLHLITVPKSVTTMAGNALSYPDRTVICGIAGSYAERYADDNGYQFVDRPVAAEEVTLTDREISLYRGATKKLIPTVTPADYTDDITWKSTNTSVVTVSDRGVLQAVGVGTATVKLVIGNVSVSCTVNVYEPITSVTLNKTSITLNAMETYKLTATVKPTNATYREIAWTSADASIATVDENGVVTAHGKGTVTITAAAADGSGKYATCTVTVNNTGYVIPSGGILESEHNYANACRDFWIYSVPGATSLTLTFDDRTEIEESFDYLIITDGFGGETSYTGSELAGQTITVEGDTVRLQMNADSSGSTWGFLATCVPEGITLYPAENGNIFFQNDTGIITGADAAVTSIRIPEQINGDDVTAIAEDAFAGCHSLTQVIIRAEDCEIGDSEHTLGDPEKTTVCSWKDSPAADYAEEYGYTFEKLIDPCPDGTHEFVTELTAEATCTEDGSETLTCTVCDYSYTVVLPATGHNPVTDSAVRPTCTTDGYTEGSHCEYCGEVFTAQIHIPALGHDYDDGTVSTAATCTAEGVMTFTCADCGGTRTEAIPMLAHSPVTDAAVAPTCLTAGLTEGSHCEACGTVLTAQIEIAALGHDLILVPQQEPTCTAPGMALSCACSRCGELLVPGAEIPALGHSFIDGSCIRCGLTETEVNTLKITSAALRLNENINMVYTVNVPTGYQDPYMTFAFAGKECTVSEYTVNKNGQYCFELADINPQCMGDSITATLYATCDGKEYTDIVAEYSVREYCVNQLAKTDDAELIALLSDILTYGAAAQVYMEYKTDALVTDGLDLTPTTFEAISGKTVSFTGEQDENTCWIGASLVLSNDLATRFAFVTDSTDGLTIEVSINGRTQTFDTFEDAGNGRYCITFDGIMATEFDDTVTATFYRNGEQIGAAVNYSVNTYICSTQNVENANLQALVRALYNYGASAKAYAD